MKSNQGRIFKMASISMLAALSFVVFTYLQVKVPLPAGDATSFHLGNAVCVLGALLMSGFAGGLGGAIGMTIGDLMDPIYIIYAPKTFVLKLCIGLVTGVVAHKFGKIHESRDPKHILKWVIIASTCGMLFNTIFDPLVGYFYKLLIMGKPAAQLVLAWNIGATSVNSILSVVVGVSIYMALRPALEKAGIYRKLH